MIEVLIGMVGSGKSTYCSQRALEGCVILNDDSIINMVHGGHYDLYNESWKPLYKSIEDHVLHVAVAMGKDLIIDRGVNISISSRVRWVALARSLDTPIRAVKFQIFPVEVHATRRHAADPRGHSYAYWFKVAYAHAARYESPELLEGFCEILEKEWKP